MAQVFERLKLLLAADVGVVARELLGEAVAAGEGAGKDDAGLVAQRFGQYPPFGQVLAGAGVLVGLHQRDARLAQGVDAGGDGELGGDVEGVDELRRHTILFDKVEWPRPAGELDDLGWVGDRFETAAAVFALDQPGDALLNHLVAEALRDEIDELLAAQDAHGVVGVHDWLVRARQAKAGAADDHRTQRRLVAVVGALWRGAAVALQRRGQRLRQRVERSVGLQVVVHITSVVDRRRPTADRCRSGGR